MWSCLDAITDLIITHPNNQLCIGIDNRNHTIQQCKEVSLQRLGLVLLAIPYKIHYLQNVTGETIFSNVQAALHVLFVAVSYTSTSSFDFVDRFGNDPVVSDNAPILRRVLALFVVHPTFPPGQWLRSMRYMGHSHASSLLLRKNEWDLYEFFGWVMIRICGYLEWYPRWWNI